MFGLMVNLWVIEIGTICNEKQIHFHCDAVQGVGKLHIDAQDLNVDTLSVSAHKFYGPKGIGCLYIKDLNKINPLLHGGSQEKGLRSGTENVSGIVGFGVAAKNALRNKEENLNKINGLRNLFLKGLSENLVDWQINGNRSVPSTLSISFSGVRGEALAFALDQLGVCVSVASACSSSSSKLSHVLVSMGKSKEEIRSTIRVSIGKQNTSEEITTAIQAISSTVNKLRSFSNTFRTVKANASGKY
ncbi:cysteine desulfurase family protein [Virgibacillus necropolis]|uniref:Aminotransferase class V domain-containing protein n=1 Tax=Virgibacillus necropolis TaxID=163877 RepID=A0A221MDB8_9BACI|nr:aminotransferase class V-fold PLP-dependent enzyme [Virgibacillus necropolis]ASN05645.1 hypothetical protein CFK40_11795 [Virgibacillus necropolis]